VLCVATTILDAGWLGDDLRGFSDIAGDSLMTTRNQQEITCESNGRWRIARASAVFFVLGDVDGRGFLRGVFPSGRR